jgi:hypothetical protein
MPVMQNVIWVRDTSSERKDIHRVENRNERMARFPSGLPMIDPPTIVSKRGGGVTGPPDGSRVGCVRFVVECLQGENGWELIKN